MANNRRYEDPDEIKSAAHRAMTRGSFVSFHPKTPNQIYEAAKVRSVGDTSIVFDLSAIGAPDMEVSLDGFRYFEVL
jgi:hypothetical protein